MKVCGECFSDEALRSYVDLNGVEGKCELTFKKTKVIELEDLSDSFDSLLDSFVESADGTEFYTLIQQDWNIFNDAYGKFILNDLLKMRNSGLQIESLVIYSPDISLFEQSWTQICEKLLREYRYTIWDVFKKYSTVYDEAFSVHNAILKKGTKLFRSRINNLEVTFPSDKMGAPPKEKAVPGRANPEGIPYLYLSSDVKTTFYETRATYLDRVNVGVFVASKDVSLIDFSRQNSPFNPQYSSVKNGIMGEKIIKVIISDLSRPMRSSDSLLDYVPTQFICEYIKHTMCADGVLYRSSLNSSGFNYVIFYPNCFDCEPKIEEYDIDEVNIQGKCNNIVV